MVAHLLYFMCYFSYPLQSLIVHMLLKNFLVAV